MVLGLTTQVIRPRQESRSPLPRSGGGLLLQGGAKVLDPTRWAEYDVGAEAARDDAPEGVGTLSIHDEPRLGEPPAKLPDALERRAIKVVGIDKDEIGAQPQKGVRLGNRRGAEHHQTVGLECLDQERHEQRLRLDNQGALAAARALGATLSSHVESITTVNQRIWPERPLVKKGGPYRGVIGVLKRQVQSAARRPKEPTVSSRWAKVPKGSGFSGTYAEPGRGAKLQR